MEKTSLSLSNEQLREALLYTQETLDRCQIKFVLGDELARQILNLQENLSAEELVVHVHRNDIDKTHESLLDMFEPDAIKDGSEIRFDHLGVPVRVKLYETRYSFFQHPDTVFFLATQLYVPNPLTAYWEVRNEII